MYKSIELNTIACNKLIKLAFNISEFNIIDRNALFVYLNVSIIFYLTFKVELLLS